MRKVVMWNPDEDEKKKQNPTPQPPKPTYEEKEREAIVEEKLGTVLSPKTRAALDALYKKLEDPNGKKEITFFQCGPKEEEK